MLTTQSLHAKLRLPAPWRLAGAILTPAEPASRISLRAGRRRGSRTLGSSRRDHSRAAEDVRLDRPASCPLARSDEWLVIDEDGADLMAAAASSGPCIRRVDVSPPEHCRHRQRAGAEAAINSGARRTCRWRFFPSVPARARSSARREIVLFEPPRIRSRRVLAVVLVLRVWAAGRRRGRRGALREAISGPSSGLPATLSSPGEGDAASSSPLRRPGKRARQCPHVPSPRKREKVAAAG